MSLLHGEILIAGAEVTVKPLDADLKGSKLFTVLEGIAHKQGIAWGQLKVGSNVEVMVVCGLLLLKDILGTAISKVTTVGPGIKIQNGLYGRVNSDFSKLTGRQTIRIEDGQKALPRIIVGNRIDQSHSQTLAQAFIAKEKSVLLSRQRPSDGTPVLLAIKGRGVTPLSGVRGISVEEVAGIHCAVSKEPIKRSVKAAGAPARNHVDGGTATSPYISGVGIIENLKFLH